MKMKNIFFLCAASLAMLSFSSCSDDFDYGTGEGEGRVLLRPLLDSDVEVKSRAGVTDDALANEAIIWISNAKGPVRKYKGISQVPAEGLWLASDSYVAEVWAGDSVPASFEKKQYKGVQPFSISAGQTVQVEIECKIANTVVEVRYDESVGNVLSDYSMTVGHNAGSLTWGGSEDNGKVGYFMIPSFDKKLTCTLAGKLTDGSDFTKETLIENPKPATKYLLTIKHNPQGDEEIGGGLFTIIVDETAIEVEDVIEIVSAPVIQALNFDIDQLVVGESGKLTEKKLWIKSTSPFKSVEVACPTLADVLGIGGGDFEIFSMDASVAGALAEKGFTFQHHTHADDVENPDFEEVKLVFNDSFMNLLPNGEHLFTVKATDESGRSTTAMFRVIVSDAALRTEPITDVATIWATRATLRASIMRDGESGFGFNYRVAGTQQWETVGVEVASPAVGVAFETELTGLQPGTEYEYQAFCSSFTADTYRFTTEAATQLPNAGFEDWNTSSTPFLIGDRSFWDSGNHGSATMKTNVTEPDGDVKHDGNYSIRMRSEFVGVALGGNKIGKFAAGNVFSGRYLDTNGTDGELGWGRPFASRPKALRGYVKYSPVEVNCEGTKYNKPKGYQDQGIIYIAILDGSTVDFTTTKSKERYTEFPVIIQTKEVRLFDKNASNVLAYGEKILDATPGDGMIEFEIPLEYSNASVKAGHIMIIASSSKQGDYFIGGEGSTLWLDDLELVY